MKKVVVMAAVVLALVGSFFMLSKPEKSNPSTQANTMTAKTMPTSFSQIQTAMGSGAQLLDVRTAAEFTAGHIAGATNFSLQDIQAGKRPTGSKTQVIYVYCHSGNRATQATSILQGAGFTNVINLGAITQVEAIGGRLVTGS